MSSGLKHVNNYSTTEFEVSLKTIFFEDIDNFNNKCTLPMHCLLEILRRETTTASGKQWTWCGAQGQQEYRGSTQGKILPTQQLISLQAKCPVT